MPDTLDTLKSDHPRVLAHAEDFERISELVKTDPLAKRWYAELTEQARELIDEPTAVYELRDGRRLLYVSREVLDRVVTLGMLHRIEPDQAYLDRIWADLQAAADFDHWNPSHFLDVAEMGLAFALAYDWLYDDWTAAQRETLRDAIVRHAIKPGLRAYDKKVWWTRATSNWNQVCNGGLICAALAVADHEPELARQMLERAVKALPHSMKRYAPDGGYEEGPSYWAFGTIYNVFAIAALESALGSDLGLGEMPGLDETGNFPIYMTGPTGRVYNFGDGREKKHTSPAMFYLARRYDRPHYAAFAAERVKPSAYSLLWYDPAHLQKPFEPLNTDAVFHSAGIVSMRSSWDDDAWFVAAKGGYIGFGHSQMDLGSFILESQGVRWLIDLGKDGYNLPGYFEADKGGRRWGYYVNRAEGHNTLVINPDKTGGQHFDANISIDKQEKAFKIDLSDAYSASVKREIKLDIEDEAVRVIDRVRLNEPGDIWWFAHTRAEITISEDGRVVTLRQDGKTLRATMVTPKLARFESMQAKPLPTSPDPKGQNPNNDAIRTRSVANNSANKRGEKPGLDESDPSLALRKLAIRVENDIATRIEVVFENVE